MLYILTLEEIKAELKIADAQEDAQLTLWAEGMQARFDNRCNRTLLHGSETEVLDGGAQRLYLKRFPVESVESVHVSGAGVFDESTLYEAGVEYRVVNRHGQILHGVYATEPWPEGVANIQVVYTGGYYACDAESVPVGYAMPEDLRLAFMMQLTSLWRNRANLGQTAKQQDGSSVSYGNSPAIISQRMTLLPDVELILDKYTRWA